MLKIFLTNLGKYNEGELVGEWISLPISEEELEAVKERIGINEQYEEWFITDYETDITGVEVGEYDNLEELNELAETLEELDDADRIAVQAMLSEGFEFDDTVKKASDGDYMIYYDCDNMEDVAREYADETGLLSSIPENLQNYFDFEAYGRDMSFEGQFVFIDNDCVQIY